MEFTFWGVRGSIPTPGSKTAKYGGNTSCLSLRFHDLDRLIIIDAGSGIRELGNHMMGVDFPKGPIKTEIFLTHTHWDHILGFPFFTPIYIPSTHIKIYGPVSFENETLGSIVGGQLTYRYFPIRHEEIASKIEYIDLKERTYDLGDGIQLTTKYLNHPILCLGYRIEYQGKVVCTAYDTEPFQNVFCTDPEDPSYDEAMAIEGELVAKEENERLASFFTGADLLVYDAQYTKAEYISGKAGWGHTPMEDALQITANKDIKRLALFHHEPTRTDDQFDVLSKELCETSADDRKVFFAQEGMTIDI